MLANKEGRNFRDEQVGQGGSVPGLWGVMLHRKISIKTYEKSSFQKCYIKCYIKVSPDTHTMPPLLSKNQTAIDGKTTAYVRENYVCNRPVSKIADLDKVLSDISQVK